LAGKGNTLSGLPSGSVGAELSGGDTNQLIAAHLSLRALAGFVMHLFSAPARQPATKEVQHGDGISGAVAGRDCRAAKNPFRV
jgi:hypothetical protein